MAARRTTRTSSSRTTASGSATPRRSTSVKTDSKGFMKAYEDSYSYLYDTDGRRSASEQARYNKAVDEFDHNMQTDPKFAAGVNRFCSARFDCISSDREAAAYMYAMKATNRRTPTKK